MDADQWMSSEEDRGQRVAQVWQLHKQGQSLPTPLLVGITLCLAVVSLVGIAGNILVIMFFYRSLKDLPQNVYVIALAALDLAVCAVVIPTTIYQDVWWEASSDLSCKLLNILRHSLVPSSAFLLCLVAVDRFVIICFVPGVHTTRKNSLLCIALALTLGAVVGTPGGLTTGARVRFSLEKMNRSSGPDDRGDKLSLDTSVPHCTSDYSIIPEAGLNIYRNVLTALFSALLLLMVYFYARIFCFVRRRQLRWAKSRSYVAAKLRGRGAGGEGVGGGGGGDGSEDRRRCSNRTDEITEVTSWAGGDAARRASVYNDEQQRHLPCRETDIDEAEAQQQQLLLSVQNGAREKIVEFLDVELLATAEDATVRVDVATDHFEEAPLELRAKTDRGNSVASEHLAQARQDLAERRRKRPHIKTAKVLGVITFFYVLSYLPFFLVYNAYQSGVGLDDAQMTFMDVPPRNMSGNSSLWSRLHEADLPEQQMPSHVSGGGRRLALKVIFYFYFINHGANPLIYGCMNTYFKQQVWALCGSLRCRRR